MFGMLLLLKQDANYSSTAYIKAISLDLFLTLASKIYVYDMDVAC